MIPVTQVSCGNRVFFVSSMISDEFSGGFKLASSISPSLQLVKGSWIFEIENYSLVAAFAS